MDRKRILPLAWLPFLMLFLTACLRSASSPAPTLVSALENPVPTPVPFPLAPASTWIYEYRAYTEDQQATWVVTETIVAAEERDGLLVAEVERLIRLQEGQPGDSLITPPEDGISWYILRGADLFRQYGALDSGDILKNARLEMVFPPESVPCWPLDDALGPLERGASGCRSVSSSLPVYETRAGTFENCVELLTPYLSGSILTVFCPNVGFMAEKYDHFGSSFGYEFVLTGYSLPLP
jgi:hypothetical protein